MIVLEPIRDGLLDMWAYKTRTVLQTLGILLGSASVIVTIALLIGGREEDREFMQATGGVTTLEVRKDEGGRVRMFAREQLPFGVVLEDVEAVRAAVEPLGAVVTATRVVNRELTTPEGRDEARVWGVTAEHAAMKLLSVAEGRFLSASDLEGSEPVIVLGSGLKETLFGNGNALGRDVTLRAPGGERAGAGAPPARAHRRYRVVGVLKEKVYKRSEDQNNWLAWMNELAYVPLTAMLAREVGGRDVGSIAVRAPDLESVKPVKRALDDALVKRHRGVRNYAILDRAERLAEWEERGVMYEAAIGGAGAISLLVGGIVVMNILLASLTQRIREVGIRKAVGARNSEIFLQFLTESVIVAGLGGAGGALLGSGVAGIVSRMMEQKLTLSPWVMALGVGVSMTVGLVFGVYPAIRAARLDPVVALRYE